MGISAHGTRVTRNGDEIPNLSDVTPPALMRHEVDDTRHIDQDERFVVGIRRVGELGFDVDFLDGLDDLVTAWMNNTRDDYAIFLPDGARWNFSGVVVDVMPKAPVEGRLMARVSIRPVGALTIPGVGPFLLNEDGTFILQAEGGRIVLENQDTWLTEGGEEILTEGGELITV